MEEESGADKLREYDALVESVTRSNESLNGHSLAKLDELIKDLNVLEDPIYLNNCLQLVADLARSPDALKLLESKLVPQKILQFLNESDPLIVPHAMKFFYHINPRDLESKYPGVLNKVYDYFDSGNNQLVDYAIDLISSIGRRGFAARKILDNNPRFRQSCLKQLESKINNSEPLLKCRALACIRDLLEVYENDPREESSRLSDEFYHSVIPGENKMTDRLFALCQVPFKDINESAILVVDAIKDLDWGQKELTANQAFSDFMKTKSCSYKDRPMNSPAFCSNS